MNWVGSPGDLRPMDGVWVRLTFRSGREAEGKLVAEDAETITLSIAGGCEMTFPRDQVVGSWLVAVNAAAA